MIGQIRPVRRLGAWLALAALLIQSALPLADAVFHRYWHIDDGIAALAVADVGPHAAALSKLPPAHATHECPICEFMLALGSFSPPAAGTDLALPFADDPVVWPTAPPAARAARTTAAQPRAPPVLI